jgi:hypothetical protein
MYSGPDDEALTLPNAAAKLLTDHPVRNDEIYAYGLRAVAENWRGDVVAARGAAERAIAMMEQAMPTSVYAMEGYCGAVETAVSLQSQNATSVELLRLARRGCRQLSRFARVFPVAAPRAYLFRSAFLASSGHRARALGMARLGLAAAIELGILYDQVRAHLQLAHLLGKSEEAAKHRESARALCDNTGIASDWADFQKLEAR